MKKSFIYNNDYAVTRRCTYSRIKILTTRKSFRCVCYSRKLWLRVYIYKKNMTTGGKKNNSWNACARYYNILACNRTSSKLAVRFKYFTTRFSETVSINFFTSYTLHELMGSLIRRIIYASVLRRTRRRKKNTGWKTKLI